MKLSVQVLPRDVDRSERKMVLALVIFACLVRIAYWAARPALWGDEAALAMNIVPKALTSIGRPFEYYQICPIGYLIAAKLVTLVGGGGEHSLRFFSLLQGMTVPPLVWLAARRAGGIRTGLVALFLASTSPALIRYSSELKPYVGDAAIAAIVLCIAIGMRPRLTSVARLGLLGLLAPWFSLPAILVIGGLLGAFMLLELAGQRRASVVIALIGVGITTAVSFALCMMLLKSEARAASAHQVREYWADGFMPFPPKSLADLRWPVGKFFYFFTDPSRYPRLLSYPLGLLALFGAYRLRNHRALLLTIVLGAVITLAASAVHGYPVSGRLSLYLIPASVLLLGSGFGGLFEASGRVVPALAAAGLAGAVVPSLVPVAKSMVPSSELDLADLAHLVKAEMKPGEGLFLDQHSAWGFLYYAWQNSLRGPYTKTWPTEPEGLFHAGQPQPHLANITPLFSMRRVYAILSDFPPPEGGDAPDRYYTWFFEASGARRERSFHAQGFWFIVYDVSHAHPLATLADRGSGNQAN